MILCNRIPSRLRPPHLLNSSISPHQYNKTVLSRPSLASMLTHLSVLMVLLFWHLWHYLFLFLILHIHKFLSVFFFNWSIVDLQCCARFWCTEKWFSYTYKYIYSFSYSFHYGLLSDTEYNSLCYTLDRILLFIYFIYSSMYLLIPNS